MLKPQWQNQPRGMKLSEFGYRWQDVVQAIFERHEAIQDLFFTGAGKRLRLSIVN